MADHQTFPVKPKPKPKPRTQTQTPESKYWSSFKTHQIPDLFSAVTSLAFSPSNATFAAAHSASLTLFSPQTLSPAASISSFSDVVSSAAFRSDGLLLAAADLSGLVQVFDAKSRTPLRKLRPPTTRRPVRFVRFPRADKLHLLSGGDDAVVRFWDVAAESPLSELLGHRDYVRCGDFSPASDETFATGSYDHTVKLWDVRVTNSSQKAVMEIDHGKPVESVAFLPSGGMVATAGGSSVKVWDVIGGGKMVCAMESHNKTVTSLCLAKFGDENRIVSVALDGFLKVFDYSRAKVTHSMRFPAPLMSVALSPDCAIRAIGTSNGVIYAGRRKVKEGEGEERRELGSFVGKEVGNNAVERRVLRPTNFRYFTRGQNEKASEGDLAVMWGKKAKVSEHDKLLRKFRHKEALEAVLEGKNPENLVAVLEELVARRKLVKCVENLEAGELGLLLGFLGKYASMPTYSGLLMGLARKVVEMKAEEIRASEELSRHVRNLKRAVEEEIRIQNSLLEIQGIVSPLLRIAGRR